MISPDASLRDIQAELEPLQLGVSGPASDPPELISHILARYHQVHCAEFPEAIRLARRVEAVHRAKDSCPHGLADHLALMFDDLEGHQQKEEAVLFPMMLRGRTSKIALPMARIISEHLDIGEQLEELARLTMNFTPPSVACTTWRALYGMCHKLDADLREHVRLENDVLFPQFA